MRRRTHSQATGRTATCSTRCRAPLQCSPLASPSSRPTAPCGSLPPLPPPSLRAGSARCPSSTRSRTHTVRMRSTCPPRPTHPMRRGSSSRSRRRACFTIRSSPRSAKSSTLRRSAAPPSVVLASGASAPSRTPAHRNRHGHRQWPPLLPRERARARVARGRPQPRARKAHPMAPPSSCSRSWPSRASKGATSTAGATRRRRSRRTRRGRTRGMTTPMGPRHST
mmetsp:Transcript_18028/g.54299  ORF Transcript_18028/g.54299 Transcript_18028/m.54299 type:complete len:224 (+) Transcript_18028:611-1282(+)